MSSESEIVWHPRLHTMFDETLYFVGVSVFLWKYFAEEIDRIITRAFGEDKPSYTVYMTYGQQDILLRLYSTDKQRKKLIETISDALHFGGGEITHFDVTKAHYIWGYEVLPENPKPDITVMEQIDPLELKKAQQNWQKTPEHFRKKLIDERIVLGTFQNPSEKIRGLTSVSLRSPNVAQVADITQRLLKRFAKEQLLESKAVIGMYEGFGVGIGFGQILIESNANEYETIWHISEVIQEILGSERAKVTTHLSAKPPVEYGEKCSFVGLRTEVIERIWTAEFPALDSIPFSGEKLGILQLCEDWRVWLREKKDQFARSFVECRIRGQLSTLANVIGGLSTKTENALRKYVTEGARKEFGDKWQSQLEKMFKHGTSYPKWGLGDLVEFVSFWSGRGKELMTVEQIGNLRDFVYVRNMFVHGRVRKDLRDVDIWRKCQEVLGGVFVAYYSKLAK